MKKIHKLTINSALLIAIIGILLILVGTSYAVFSTAITSQKTQIIKVGILKLELTEPIEGLNLGPIFTKTDAQGLSQENYYDFSLTNVGDAHSTYKILLIDDEDSLLTYEGELLSINYIKFGIEVNEEEKGPFNLGTTQRVLNEGIIKKNEEIDFRLRIWLNFTGLSIQEKELLNGQQVFFKIKVEAEQYLEDVDDLLGTEYDFAYTGNYQEFVVPKTGYYEVELWGASGAGFGGAGGYTKGTIYMIKEEKYYIYVGGVGSRGTPGVNSPSAVGQGGIGGYNGGGNGGNAGGSSGALWANYSGGMAGGGATDIRYFASTPTSTQLTWNNIEGLRSRIMVAGGGGGTNLSNVDYDKYKSTGGGLTGDKGGLYAFIVGYPTDITKRGAGATQLTGGTFGVGGTGAITGSSTSCHGHSGGGGGYYGGAGGQSTAGNCHMIGGGGGSSYISGYAGVNSITSISSSTANNNTNHYSNKYFLKPAMVVANTAEISEVVGKSKITYVGATAPAKTNTKLDNVRYIKSCINGNSLNTNNHWVELQAIKDGVNIAKEKTPTGTVAQYSTTYPYSAITDGNIDYTTYGGPITTGLQCITVDLGNTYDLDEVGLWLHWEDVRKYYDNTLSVGTTNASGTTALSTVLHSYPGTTGYNETSEGKRHTAWD